MTTLAEPLARALYAVPGWGITMGHYDKDILAALRNDPETLAALAEALKATSDCSDTCDHDGVEFVWVSYEPFAAALADALFGDAMTAALDEDADKVAALADVAGEVEG